MSSYERKLQLILQQVLPRYQGKHTPEQLSLETQVAHNMLATLGVRP
jgi:hypothetical protein